MRLLVLVALVSGVAAAQAARPGVLTIRFLDVGQGDAVLITAPEGQSLLYDGGRSEKRMTELLDQYRVTSLAVVAASHADADHITGLIPAVQQFKPKFFLNNGIAATTQTFGKLTATVKAAGTQGLLASDRVINLGSVKVTVLPPPPGMPKGEQNLNSVGLLIEYGKFRALMTGDSEAPETVAWLKKYPASTFGPIDVYKSIHHGAKNGDNPAWLAAVRPKNVVVSVGPNRSPGPLQTGWSGHLPHGSERHRDRAGAARWTVRHHHREGDGDTTARPSARDAPCSCPAAQLRDLSKLRGSPRRWEITPALRSTGLQPQVGPRRRRQGLRVRGGPRNSLPRINRQIEA